MFSFITFYNDGARVDYELLHGYVTRFLLNDGAGSEHGNSANFSKTPTHKPSAATFQLMLYKILQKV
ncbi:MAG: hypothetical protein ABIT08_05310 [Bacteroidia bacterium]